MRREGSKYSLISGTCITTNATVKSCPSCGTMKSHANERYSDNAAVHANRLLQNRILFKDSKSWHELDEQSVDALVYLGLLDREDDVAVTWGHLSEWDWARIGLYAKRDPFGTAKIEHARCVSFGKLNSKVPRWHNTFGKNKNDTGSYAGLLHLSRKDFNRDFVRVKQRVKAVGSGYCDA
ncbi:hypothetical protein BJ741DRAFT_617017 [Chytriomyces cf. hyalinus JEL632]|nr:hypothetical protein BJ741DRAFT_617017 [Chytriomyces cf. hyalinus JEL632]